MKKKTTTITRTNQITEQVSTAVIVSVLEKKADPAIKKLENWKKKISVVKTQADFDLVGEQLKFVKACGKEAQAEEDRMLKGIKDSIKAIQNHFKPFKQKIALLDNEYNTLLQAFVLKQEEKKLQLDKDFGTKVKKISTYAEKKEELTIQYKGGAQIRNQKQVFITDKKKIPLEYMEPNLSKIKEDLIAGKKVPGCELKVVKIVAV